MNNRYCINDLTIDSFIHSSIESFYYDFNNKKIEINYSYLDLKEGGCLYDCKLQIKEWEDFSVVEKGAKVNKKYELSDIPIDIEQIIEYKYNGVELELLALGYLDIDSLISYKFINPVIIITGDYEGRGE